MRVTDNSTHRFSPSLTRATCCGPEDSACCDEESRCGGGDSDNGACC